MDTRLLCLWVNAAPNASPTMGCSHARGTGDLAAICLMVPTMRIDGSLRE